MIMRARCLLRGPRACTFSRDMVSNPTTKVHGMNANIPATAAKSLADVIGEIESSNNPSAIRFEPSVYAGGKNESVIQAIMAANDCDRDTACVLYACSFGEFQIMGFNLWGETNLLGSTCTLAHYLIDQDLQADTFDHFLILNNIDWSLSQLLADPEKLDRFAAVYNGSLVYAETIRQVAAR